MYNRQDPTCNGEDLISETMKEDKKHYVQYLRINQKTVQLKNKMVLLFRDLQFYYQC